MLDVCECSLPGLRILLPAVQTDARGSFVKIFHENFFESCGLETVFREIYYSTSIRGVLRGLHFQLPPEDHAKLVYCAAGRVLDAVVDLRLGSPTYGRHEVIDLSADIANCIYIPSGFAHGFYVRSETAIVHYCVTTQYAPECDAGIRWDSAGIAWPDSSPILSARDKKLPPLGAFNSPFRYNPNA